MRWHDILRVLDDYRVRAVRVKQHDGGGAPSRTERLVAAPNGTRIPSSDGTEGRLVFGKLTVTNQAGRRIRAGLGVVPRSVSIIMLCVLLRISGYRTGISMTMGLALGFTLGYLSRGHCPK